MATIHSLPQELVHAILSLAYPPGEAGSYKGLTRTSLVHPSWRSPSQTLMTQRITFSKQSKQSLAKFVEGGPTGFKTQVLSFAACPAPDIKVILGKAQAGGIRRLELVITTQRMIKGLFNLSSLNKLDGLSLTVQYKPKKNSTQASQIELNFGSWPSRLSAIIISSPIIPYGLFYGSQSTLTKLDLNLTEGDPSTHLASLEWYCPNLSHFTLRQPTKVTSFDLSPEITRFIQSLPHLTSLALTKVWPHQLEQVLLQLKPDQHLTQVGTSLWRPSNDIPSFGPYDQDRAMDEWEPTLRRCIGLPPLRTLKRWQLSLSDPANPGSVWQGDADEFHYDPVVMARWAAFPGEVAAAGIELVLSPLE